MSKKVEQALHGPSWTEVILGAVLSLLLGAVLGAVLLVLRPVKQVRELPKEADLDRKAVYYVEGSRDSGKARQAAAKRQAFLAGQSVAVTEDEINSLVPAPASSAPKPTGQKGEAAPTPTTESGMLVPGALNVRIRDNALQVGVPVTVNVLGLSQKLIVQARGGFEKDGATFVYEPRELYVGSCPVQRLPFVSGFVRSKVIAAQPIPEDVAAAWSKVSGVEIEGATLKVAVQ